MPLFPRPVRGWTIIFHIAIILTLAVVFALSSLATYAITHATGSAYVRVNQVGYLKGETKQAILMASGSESGASFKIINTSNGRSVYGASIGAGQGKWSGTFPDTYVLDFSAVQGSGTYKIVVSGPIAATSPTFKIGSGSNLYAGLLPNVRFFYEAQRDGPHVISSVMNRRPSHLTDEHAYIYSTPTYKNDVLQGSLHKIAGPIDVSGGWFDAGDYLKFVQTASYTDAIMLLAVRRYPSLFSSGPANFSVEGKYGLDWLQKMWDDTRAIALRLIEKNQNEE